MHACAIPNRRKLACKPRERLVRTLGSYRPDWRPRTVPNASAPGWLGGQLVDQELGIYASSTSSALWFAIPFLEPRQAAIALLPDKERAMLLTTEVAQRHLSKYRQFMAANQAVHACRRISR